MAIGHYIELAPTFIDVFTGEESCFILCIFTVLSICLVEHLVVNLFFHFAIVEVCLRTIGLGS